MSKWFIRSKKPDQYGKFRFWSPDGWTMQGYASQFTDAEKEATTIPNNGVWFKPHPMFDSHYEDPDSQILDLKELVGQLRAEIETLKNGFVHAWTESHRKAIAMNPPQNPLKVSEMDWDC